MYNLSHKGQVPVLCPAPLWGYSLGRPHVGHDNQRSKAKKELCEAGRASSACPWDNQLTEDTFSQNHHCSMFLNKATDTSQIGDEHGHVAGKLHQSREPSAPVSLSVHTVSDRNKGM